MPASMQGGVVALYSQLKRAGNVCVCNQVKQEEPDVVGCVGIC